jgi:hypothetical protein
MSPARRRTLYAAVGALLALAVALAVLRAADEESPDASPATRETASAPRTASTPIAPPPATEPEPPPPTTRDSTAVTTEGAATLPKPLPPYSLAATRRCLRGAGFAVSKVRSQDPRLRALGDLAQRTSLELRRGGQTLGVAFGDTQLLADLLRVPDDPYRLEVRRNALLMYPPSARAAAALLRGCLRP